MTNNDFNNPIDVPHADGCGSVRELISEVERGHAIPPHSMAHLLVYIIRKLNKFEYYGVKNRGPDGKVHFGGAYFGE